MKHFPLLLLFLPLVFSPLALEAQEYTGRAASQIIPGTKTVVLDRQTKKVDLAVFSPPVENVNPVDASGWLVKTLKTGPASGFRLIHQKSDRLEMEHAKYRQTAGPYPVEYSAVTVHSKNGKIVSISGAYYPGVQGVPSEPAIHPAQAVDIARSHIAAREYRDETTTEPPEPVVLPLGDSYRTAYKTDVYALRPLSRKYVYVDAATGEVLMERDRIHHGDAIGTAHTRYSGVREITTDSTDEGLFRLYDGTRGGGILTLDMNGSTYYSEAEDITDDDNIWEADDHDDNAALDAHWGAEMTYDYFLETHGRNSIDDNGAELISYVDYDFQFSNAFWNGEVMTYGAGDEDYNPFTCLDVVAHEITHGVTEHSAELIYWQESGALNESFSDIFGVAVDFYARGEDANYLLGEDIHWPPFRSLSNPKNHFAPDTYLGEYWWVSWSDNGGVHTNSGVQNHWFYLLCEGGAGTNDNGDAYQVNAIGMSTAAAIAYRSLTTYLTPTSEYEQARSYSIQAAIDLYGDCSDEVMAATNAWYAVGVGEAFSGSTVSIFHPVPAEACHWPVEITFVNQSIHGEQWFWDFGDGTTSTEQNPTHTYTETGVYTVSLVTTASVQCQGVDTLVMENAVSISDLGAMAESPCTPGNSLPSPDFLGIQSVVFGDIDHQTEPSESVYESFVCTESTELVAGQSYPLEIVTNGHQYVALFVDLDNDGFFSPQERLFTSFVHLSENHTGNVIIPEGVYGQPLRMRVISDVTRPLSGCHHPYYGQVQDYRVELIENVSAPEAFFTTSDTVFLVGQPVEFQDLSLNLPQSWQWHFENGTPASSSLPEPTITYADTGVFDVSLIVANEFGSDTLVLSEYIRIKHSVNLCETSSTVAPSGTFYDLGGADEDYAPYGYCSLKITPPCATEVALIFDHLQLSMCCGDGIWVYDGTGASTAPIAVLDGTSMPDTLVATSGSMFIRYVNSYGPTDIGWEAHWISTADTSPPTAQFSVSDINPQIAQEVVFTDGTSGDPTHWFWNFGDGFSSTFKNPIHAFMQPGPHTVSLIAENCAQSDTISQVITVQEPPQTVLSGSDTLEVSLSCGDSSSIHFTVYNQGQGGATVDFSILLNETPQVLALLTHSGYWEVLHPTMTAINQHFTQYEITTTTAATAANLTEDLEGMDILMIPHQYDIDPTFFVTLSPVLTDFVYNGGKVLICGNRYVGGTGLFPEIQGDYESEGYFQNLQSDHPIMDGLAANFPLSDLLRSYSWDENQGLSILATSEYTGNAVIAVSEYGEGTAVYLAMNYQWANDNASLIIGNTMRFLAELISPPWLHTPTNFPQNIPPGDSLVVGLQIDAAGLSEGDYYHDLVVKTGIPGQDSLGLVAHLGLWGEPAMNVSESPMVFDSVMVDANMTLTRSLTISNEDCGLLNIQAQTFSEEFDVYPQQLDIPGYGQDTLWITFAPPIIGTYTDSLVLSGGGQAVIPLEGHGIHQPEFVIHPHGPTVEGTVCSDSVLVTFDVFNPGEFPLEFQLTAAYMKMTLENGKNILDTAYYQLNSLIPNLYNFSGGESGYSLNYSSNLYYPSGNILNTENLTEIPYTGSIIVESDAFGDETQYFTAKYPQLFVLGADIDSLEYFSVTGNPIGYGGWQEREYTFTNRAGVTYSGFVTSKTPDMYPSINHVIFSEFNGEIGHSYSTSPIEENHVIEGFGANKRLYHFLFAEMPYSFPPPETVYKDFFEKAVGMLTVQDLDVDLVEATVQPSDTFTVSTYIHSPIFLTEGNKEVILWLVSNDPDHPEASYEVTVQIPVDVCPKFDLEYGGGCNGKTVFTDGSTNGPTAWNWDFGDGSSSSEQNPIHYYDHSGEYTATLTACKQDNCNSISKTVTIGEVGGPSDADCTPQTDEEHPESHITSILFSGESYSYVNESTGSAVGYEDFTCQEPITLVKGETYQFVVGLADDGLSHRVRAGVDFNNDGVFGSGEYFISTTTSNGYALTWLTIPATAALDAPLRMRVIMDPYLNSLCGPLTIGEAEDYTMVVTAHEAPPIPDFSIAPFAPCSGKYQFWDNSEFQVDTWLWDFGDGNVSSEPNPLHTYAGGGEYLPTLTVTNEWGSDSIQKHLSAPYQGLLEFHQLTYPILVGEAAQFEVVHDGVQTIIWDFGDGNYETGTAFATHTYQQTGSYTITVHTEEDVCNDELWKYVMAFDADAVKDPENSAGLVRVFPNPTTGEFTLSLPELLLLTEIRVFDAVGKSIDIGIENLGTHRPRVIPADPSPGVYHLEAITTEGRVLRGKVLVVR